MNLAHNIPPQFFSPTRFSNRLLACGLIFLLNFVVQPTFAQEKGKRILLRPVVVKPAPQKAEETPEVVAEPSKGISPFTSPPGFQSSAKPKSKSRSAKRNKTRSAVRETSTKNTKTGLNATTSETQANNDSNSSSVSKIEVGSRYISRNNPGVDPRPRDSDATKPLASIQPWEMPPGSYKKPEEPKPAKKKAEVVKSLAFKDIKVSKFSFERAKPQKPASQSSRNSKQSFVIKRNPPKQNKLPEQAGIGHAVPPIVDHTQFEASIAPPTLEGKLVPFDESKSGSFRPANPVQSNTLKTSAIVAEVATPSVAEPTRENQQVFGSFISRMPTEQGTRPAPKAKPTYSARRTAGSLHR